MRVNNCFGSRVILAGLEAYGSEAPLKREGADMKAIFHYLDEGGRNEEDTRADQSRNDQLLDDIQKRYINLRIDEHPSAVTHNNPPTTESLGDSETLPTRNLRKRRRSSSSSLTCGSVFSDASTQSTSSDETRFDEEEPDAPDQGHCQAMVAMHGTENTMRVNPPTSDSDQQRSLTDTRQFARLQNRAPRIPPTPFHHSKPSQGSTDDLAYFNPMCFPLCGADGDLNRPPVQAPGSNGVRNDNANVNTRNRCGDLAGLNVATSGPNDNDISTSMNVPCSCSFPATVNPLPIQHNSAFREHGYTQHPTVNPHPNQQATALGQQMYMQFSTVDPHPTQQALAFGEHTYVQTGSIYPLFDADL